MTFLQKIKFISQKKPLLVITGRARESSFKLLSVVLKRFPIDQKEPLIFKSGDRDIGNLRFFLNNSSFPVLLVTHVGKVPSGDSSFSGKKKHLKNVRRLVRVLPSRSKLILNFDDETVREIEKISKAEALTFGFQERALFRASDVKFNHGTNFKINYKGSVIPLWLDKGFGKEQVYSALAAIATAKAFGLNMVEVSQFINQIFFPSPGRMRLLKGIKGSWVLDDAASDSVPSMMEALNVLGKTQSFEKKIAVLGNILGAGKHSIEAREAIGGKVAKTADLLFTFGRRAKFIAEEAQIKRMDSRNIFSFDAIEEGTSVLKSKIRKGDLILIDGSREIKMQDLVKKIALSGY